MSELELIVAADDRARVVMAALAASDWPEREQAQEPHAVHQHSKQTRQFVSGLCYHDAVSKLNRLLDSGMILEDLFAAALRSGWPNFEPNEPLPSRLEDGEWCASLARFNRDSGIAAFWADHEAVWSGAIDELTAVFRGRHVIRFLSRFAGARTRRSVTVIPCLVYPMLSPRLAETTADLFLILPPAKAWGESPPWPFSEDPGWAVAQTCWYLTPHFLSVQLSQVDDAERLLLRHAAVTLCLDHSFDEAEAMAYLVRTKKEQALPKLPMVVEQMREALLRSDINSLLGTD